MSYTLTLDDKTKALAQKITDKFGYDSIDETISDIIGRYSYEEEYMKKLRGRYAQQVADMDSGKESPIPLEQAVNQIEKELLSEQRP